MSLKVSYFAVGILNSFIMSFEKIFEPSIIAALLSGPKQGIPALCKLSTAPKTKGSSGATTANSISFSTANFVMPSISLAPILTQVASLAIAPLPGSAKISVTFSLSRSFLIMACSLPPPPTTIILTVTPQNIIVYYIT